MKIARRAAGSMSGSIAIGRATVSFVTEFLENLRREFIETI